MNAEPSLINQTALLCIALPLQMLQQRLLREGRRHQPAGDELPGGGLPVRRRVRPERVAGDVRALLRRPPVRDLCLDLQATPAGGPRLLPQDVCCLSEDDGATTTTTSSSCKQQLAA